MMLIILDKDPIRSAHLVPDKIKFKQLIELGQLVCSAGISDIYKSIPQGKELQRWVKDNPKWTLAYYNALFLYCVSILNINMSIETSNKICQIKDDLASFCRQSKAGKNINTAIFRYQSGYNSVYPSKTMLPIKECIKEYQKYVQWKGSKWQ